MRAVRRGAMIGGSVVGTVMALVVAVDCASPTEIIIDISADSNLCQDTGHPLSIGIGVSTADGVNTAQPEDFQKGCKDNSTGEIGSEVIKPNGDKSATIGIRVVASVGGNATDCATDLSNCIVSTRIVQFQPGQTVRETINLSGQCKGEVCGENQDCVAGQCVDRNAVQNDGGVPPDTSTSPPEAAPPPPDTGAPDTGVDACVNCNWGNTANVTCDGTKDPPVCNIPCTEGTCAGRNVCGNGFACVITCDGTKACVDMGCGPGAKSCTFNCGGTTSEACSDVSCDAGSCTYDCKGDAPGLSCDTISAYGNDNKITCDPTAAPDASCDNVTCQGDKCARTCNGAGQVGCGATATCDGGGCNDPNTWNVFVPPPAPDQ